MPDQIIVETNRKIEVIYEYSDITSNNISNVDDINIEIFYNNENRKLVIQENGVRKEYSLKTPKKPENTPAILRLANFEIGVSKKLTSIFPTIINTEE